MKQKYGLLTFYILLGIIGIILILMGLKNDKSCQIPGSSLDADVAAYTKEGILIDESMGHSGIWAYTPGLLLPKGVYLLSFSYEGDEVNDLDVYASYRDHYMISLPPGNHFSIPVELTEDSKGFTIRISYRGYGSLKINSITMDGVNLLYTDTIFIAILFGIGWTCLGIFLFSGFAKRISKQQYISFAIMSTTILVVWIWHLDEVLYQGTDLGGHLMRIEGIKDGLLDGQFPVALFPQSANGYGQIGALYPSLFLYPMAVLRLLGVSLSTVYKAACFFCTAVTGMSGYTAAKSVLKSERGALLAGVVYTLSPLLIHMLYDGGGMLGASLGLMCYPLILAGLFHIIFGDRKKWYLLVIGFVAVTGSHLLSALLIGFASFLLVCIFAVRLIKEKRIWELLKAGILTVLINLWIFVPFFYYYTGEKLFFSAVSGSTDYSGMSLSGLWSDNYARNSIWCMLLMLIWLIVNKNKRKEKEEKYLFLLAVFVVNLLYALFSSSLLPWRSICSNIPLLGLIFENIQFSYRWFYLCLASGALFAGTAAADCRKNYKISIVYIGFLVILFADLSMTAGVYVKNYLNKDMMLNKTEGTISQYIMREYLPPDTKDEYFESKSYSLSDEQAVSVNGYVKNGTNLTFSYETTQEEQWIELPVFYYRNYEAVLEDGTVLSIKPSDTWRIQMMLPPSTKVHTVSLSYKMPWFLSVSLGVSVIVAGAVAVRGYIHYRRRG